MPTIYEESNVLGRIGGYVFVRDVIHRRPNGEEKPFVAALLWLHTPAPIFVAGFKTVVQARHLAALLLGGSTHATRGVLTTESCLHWQLSQTGASYLLHFRDSHAKPWMLRWTFRDLLSLQTAAGSSQAALLLDLAPQAIPKFPTEALTVATQSAPSTTTSTTTP